MTEHRIGSLCSGYGGLELAVQAALGGSTAWVSDIDKGACKILAHRFPDVPNIGDMTAVDWTAVEPVDVLCGGTPCQDLSSAGARRGMTEGTRSNLWVAMREAIATIRPSLVIWENVGGAYSARAHSALEWGQGLLGDRPGRPLLRALGRVLGDLASLGYDASWHGIRAADIGAPHGRFRVFVVATDTRNAGSLVWPPGLNPIDTGRRPEGTLLPTPITGTPTRRGGARSDELLLAGIAQELGQAADLLPTPTTDDAGNLTRDSGDFQSLTRTITNLLPTPVVTDMGANMSIEAWDEWAPRQKSWDGRPAPHGKSLDVEARRLFGTPTAIFDRIRSEEWISVGQTPDEFAATYDGTWGDYAPAIHRWEALTRPAPPPTQQDWQTWRTARARRFADTAKIGHRGSVRRFTVPPPHRLSPGFSEWLMGLAAGWVTDVPEIGRNEALKALGNGVVPQQAEAAIRLLVYGQQPTIPSTAGQLLPTMKASNNETRNRHDFADNLGIALGIAEKYPAP